MIYIAGSSSIASLLCCVCAILIILLTIADESDVSVINNDNNTRNLSWATPWTLRWLRDVLCASIQAKLLAKRKNPARDRRLHPASRREPSLSSES